MRHVYTALLRAGRTDDFERVKVLKVDDLRVPIHIALGRYEAATEEELNDLITDLQHELARRVPPDGLRAA